MVRITKGNMIAMSFGPNSARDPSIIGRPAILSFCGPSHCPIHSCNSLCRVFVSASSTNSAIMSVAVPSLLTFLPYIMGFASTASWSASRACSLVFPEKNGSTSKKPSELWILSAVVKDITRSIAWKSSSKAVVSASIFSIVGAL